MAKEEWGTKRICPETGKRFYDLNNSPVISPYTGKELIFDDDYDSSELDYELLEEDDQDTVPLEEITDVPSSESEEN